MRLLDTKRFTLEAGAAKKDNGCRWYVHLTIKESDREAIRRRLMEIQERREQNGRYAK